jgi:succinate dehydrogenase / fumarate reductase cytochrome b subunit
MTEVGGRTLRYAYYPGCASREITREADLSTRLVAGALGIELHDMPRANCCGAGLMTDYGRGLSVALNARIFAEAERMSMDIMTICSTCLMVLSASNRDLRNDPPLLEGTNAALSGAGLHYGGGVRVVHLLWVLARDYGLEGLKKKVLKPLSWLRAAPFYGCHTLRPSDALGFDDPARPSSLDAVLKALGAEAVEYRGKTGCCGFQADLVAEETALGLTARRLIEARESGADCLVTPCPFCHINLDNYQGLAEKKTGQRFALPVFHLSQIVGLAIGLKADELGLERHMVSPERLVGHSARGRP